MHKVTIKRNLIIFHKPHEWAEIYQLILRDFGVKMTISFVLKRELGFTVRHHQGLVPHDQEARESLGSDWPHKYHYEQQIHLDFYSEAAQSWFQLKYLNRPSVAFMQQ
jgi:hypothetical protein